MDQSTHNSIAMGKSRIMYGVCIGFTILIIAILSLVVGYLMSIGLYWIRPAFFTQMPIPIGMKGAPGGMLNALVGTCLLIAISSGVGIPVGLLTGLYLSEYDAGSWLARPVRFFSDVLAGVPSIVVGIIGYTLLVAPTANPNGPFSHIPYFNQIHSNSGWAGAMALAFIMVPIVARTTEEMLRLVPGSYRDASIALGATKAGTIIRVVIPSAMGSLITGIMLSVARVAGETAPLLFTAGSSSHFETDPRNPFPSLTVYIYNYATGPYRDQKRLAWAGIIVLILLIFILNLSVRFVTRQRKV